MLASRVSVFILGLLALTSLTVAADDLEDYVGVYGAENGQRYMQPLADVMIANMNGGLFHSAYIPREGFHFCVGVEGMVSPIGDDQRTFTATTEAPFAPEQTLEVPTVFGDTQGAQASGTGGTVYYFPGGFDVQQMPAAVPQLTIGSIYGTEGILRFTATETNETIGKVELLGLGARHSISQYFSNSPVDLAASFLWQSFTVGEIVDASALSFGVQASRSTGILTGYVGLAFESGTLDLDYEQEVAGTTQAVSYELEADNSVRLTLGATLDLSVLRLHADYSLAAQNTIGIGFGVGTWPRAKGGAQ